MVRRFPHRTKHREKFPVAGRGTQGLWRMGMSDTDFQVVWVTVL